MFGIGVVGGRKEHGAILEDRPARELLQNSCEMLQLLLG